MSEITVYVIDLEQARELKMSDEAETAVVKLSEHDDIIRLKNLEHDELTRQNKILREALTASKAALIRLGEGKTANVFMINEALKSCGKIGGDNA